MSAPARSWPPQGWHRPTSTTEERRQAILAAKPRCKVCDRLFRRGGHPSDLICFDCRVDPPAFSTPRQEDGLW